MKIRVTVENTEDLAQVRQFTVDTDVPLDYIANELVSATEWAIRGYHYTQRQGVWQEQPAQEISNARGDGA